MSHDHPAATVERFWRLMEDRNWRAARALLAPGFACVWPQSSERFPGPDAFVAMNEAHPAPNWHVASIAVQTTEEGVVAEVVVTTDSGADSPSGSTSFGTA